MFITITPLEEEHKSVLKRLRHLFSLRLRSPRPVIRRVDLPGSYFTDIRVHTHHGKFDDDWQDGIRLSCRYALCAQGYSLPPGCLYAVGADDIRQLVARVLCNTAIQVLEMSGLPLYCRRIGFIDLDCSHPSLLEQMIQHVPEVLVYTNNHALYQGYAEKILDEYGAPITFTDELTAMVGTTVVLHMGGTESEALPTLRVMSGDGNGMLLEKPKFSLAQADDVIPPGIERDEFYTALFIRCAIRQIARLTAEELLCAGSSITPKEVAALIRLKQNHAPTADNKNNMMKEVENA